MSAQAGATPEVQFKTGGNKITFLAGEALTGHLYKPMYLSAERTVKRMYLNDNTQKFAGFLQTGDLNSDVTVASGQNVSVQLDGITYVIAAGAFSAGDYLTVSDNQGRLDTAADNEAVVAWALEAASAINQVVAALIIRCPIKGDNT